MMYERVGRLELEPRCEKPSYLTSAFLGRLLRSDLVRLAWLENNGRRLQLSSRRLAIQFALAANRSNDQESDLGRKSDRQFHRRQVGAGGPQTESPGWQARAAAASHL